MVVQMEKVNYREVSLLKNKAQKQIEENFLFQAMLTICEDENLVSFMKAGLKVRQAYISFKECWSILHKR